MAVLDKADAFAPLRAGGVLRAVLGGVAGGRNPAGMPVPLPGRSHATLSRYWSRPLRQPRRAGPGWHQHFLQLGGLDQPVAVEIDGAGVMVPAKPIEPVAADEVAVGIEAAEEGIGRVAFHTSSWTLTQL